jgi:hypothetical protein
MLIFIGHMKSLEAFLMIPIHFPWNTNVKLKLKYYNKFYSVEIGVMFALCNDFDNVF